MLKNIFQSDSPGWISNQNLINQIFRLQWHIHRTRVHEPVVFDVLIGLFDSIILKWRLSKQQSIQNNTNAPDINFIRMPCLI